jgi:uncharacterized protein (TIGR02996 family)
MTPDEAAFLVQILAQPADDNVRLVFADWLTENGQPERGEFIRVQIELVRMSYINTNGEQCPNYEPTIVKELGGLREFSARWVDLRAREQELILAGRNAVEWRGELVALLPNGHSEFRRGFVEYVSCTALDWATHAAAILAAHPVLRVGLTTDPNVGDVFHVWRNMKAGEPWQCERWPGIEFELLFLPQGTGGAE